MVYRPRPAFRTEPFGRVALPAILSSQRGLVLLITLAVISVLLVLTFSLNRNVIRGYSSTRAVESRAVLDAMAESGIRLGMAVLIRDKAESEIDSVQECWADEACLKSLVRLLDFESGGIDLSIEDEQGKLDVNALVTGMNGTHFHPVAYTMWSRFLGERIRALDMDVDAEGILDALKDWMDSEDDNRITGAGGAESDWYMHLPQPYPCKNAPVDDIGELLRIRGMQPTIFYGKSGVDGIRPFVTASSPKGASGRFGRININTAKVEVLRVVLPETRVERAEQMAAYRMERSSNAFVHDLSDPLWYKRVPGLGDVTLPPDRIAYASDRFSITATARLDPLSRRITARVLREKQGGSGTWQCRVLSWELDR